MVFRSIQALVFGAFVFLFLHFFQPFGLSNFNGNLTHFTLGFGGVTTLAMLLLNVALPRVIPKFLDSEKWTTGKEIGWTMVNICTIGLFNVLYLNVYLNSSFSLSQVLWFQMATIAVGIMPVSILILLNERTQRKRYEFTSHELNDRVHPLEEINDQSTIIKLHSNSGDGLEMHIDDLLFLKASDNYVEAYSLQGKHVQKTLLRNTLKALEEDLSLHDQLFRCHKSYLVNTDHVVRVSGNAQGFKLHLHYTEEVISVSRQYNGIIKEKLTVHH